MYVAGDIALLARLARPRIGVVTAVRGVHLERAGSLAPSSAGSASWSRRCRPTARRSSTRTTRASRACASARRRTSSTYGFARRGRDGHRGRPRSATRACASCCARPSGDVPVGTPGAGPAQRAQRARRGRRRPCGAALDASDDRGGPRGAASGAPHRTVLLRAGPWRILDDTYNACPDSMAAALELLADLPGRRVAVLGEMLELGDVAEAEHLAVGERAAAAADLLVAVGDGGRSVAEAARAAGMRSERRPPGRRSRPRPCEVLLPHLQPGDPSWSRARAAWPSRRSSRRSPRPVAARARGRRRHERARSSRGCSWPSPWWSS